MTKTASISLLTASTVLLILLRAVAPAQAQHAFGASSDRQYYRSDRAFHAEDARFHAADRAYHHGMSR